MSIRNALEELLLIVEIHQKCTKNNFAWAEVEHAKELLAQPEQKPDYYLWHDEVHEEHPTTDCDPDVYPLYLKPQPKQEPDLTTIKMEWYAKGYKQAIEEQPKREPLSDEWLKDNIGFIHRDVSFTDLVRGVEKAHGIGE